MRLFVSSYTPIPILLVMASGSTVHDVVKEIRRQRRIADLSRIKHSIIFPSHQLKPLDYSDVLRDVGVCDLSVLHLRISTLGGSQQRGTKGKPGLLDAD